MTAKPSYEELERQVHELKRDYTQLEKKLLESGSFTEEIMTYMTEGLVLTDTWGTVIFMNQRLSEMLGYLPEEIIGKCWLDLVPADQQSIAKEAEARRAQGHTDRYEIILRHKDGHKFPVLIGAGSRFDKQSSEFIGTMGVVTDITERKQAEATLLESEERIRTIGDNLQGAQLYQLRVAPDGGAMFTYVSSKVEELHEYKPEDVLKDVSLLFKRVHPADVNEWKKLTKKSIRELSTYDHTVRIVRKSGEIRWHRMISKPQKMDDGSVLFDGVEIDVTERNRAEKALREREEKYRLLFNMGVNAMFLVDDNTTQILECNNKASQLFGYSSQELLSMKMADLSTTPEATRRACQENVSKKERVYKKKDGSFISVDITSEHFCLANRAVHISAIRDITEKKQAEKALRQKTKLLQNIIDTTSDLVAVTDLEGNFKFIGPSHRFLGYDPDSLVGRNVMELVHPDDYQEAATAFAEFLANREDGRKVEYRYRRADGDYLWFETVGKFILDDAGNPKEILFSSRDFTAHKRAEGELKRIEWMLSRKPVSNVDAQTENHDQGYGDLTELNRDGIILKSIGHERLKSFANDYLELLGTSSAIYEVNGDYAFGIFASGWCRMMDSVSRKLCNTPDNVEALNSGRWLCHESCWSDCAKKAIAKRTEVDIACNGGIRMYAVPIFAGGNVIGVINFGYGDPPKDPEKLKMLADVYHLNYDDLLREAVAYDSRPPYIIEMAKKRLSSSAKLIGSMVETTQAMEALRNSEEKHRRLFETMAQGVIYQAVDGKIISANPAAEKILGLSFEQMQGKTSLDPRWRMIKKDGTEVPGTDHPTMIALRTGETVGPVGRGVFHPDRNAYVWLSITAIPLFQLGETKPFQVYATFEDVTERKRMEETLQKSEERLKLALDSVSDAVWDWRMDTGEVYFSSRWYTMLGYKPYELPQDFETWRKLLHPDNLSDSEAKIFRHLDSAEPFAIEFRMRTKSNHWRWILARGKTVEQDDQGKAVRMLGTHMDITERKQSEEERKKLQDQLSQAQKMESVGRLAGGVAHDFNNMLGVILGHTELALLQADENHDLHADLKEIQKAGQRSADITKQLLAFARKQTISPRQLDLNDTVESMLNMLRRLIGENIDLVWKPATHLWPVKMDPTQIDQILANLCVNARDAISGMGKGTGLGLATIYGIVKQNRGFINVYSEPGQGSTFKLYLPRLSDVAEKDGL